MENYIVKLFIYHIQVNLLSFYILKESSNCFTISNRMEIRNRIDFLKVIIFEC